VRGKRCTDNASDSDIKEVIVMLRERCVGLKENGLLILNVYI